MNQPRLILIVDDEQDIRDMYSQAFVLEGFNVATAENGAEAIRVAEKTHPDLILMDIKMPVMDGMDATMRLKGNPKTKDIDVIFLTAFGDPEKDMQVAHAYGAADFIKKGEGLDELIKRVSKQLQKKPAQNT